MSHPQANKLTEKHQSNAWAPLGFPWASLLLCPCLPVWASLLLSPLPPCVGILAPMPPASLLLVIALTTTNNLEAQNIPNKTSRAWHPGTGHLSCAGGRCTPAQGHSSHVQCACHLNLDRHACNTERPFMIEPQTRGGWEEGEEVFGKTDFRVKSQALYQACLSGRSSAGWAQDWALNPTHLFGS